jgi:two-component system, cell cycle response regulator DivK
MSHVVVVEDDPHNAILFRKILERRAGCSVTLTEDPAEVLELVHSSDVSLVIMDVSLRHSKWQGRPVGGVEICRLIREQALRHVPILLCTAHAMRGDAERLLRESGADDYVAKPVTDHERFAALALEMMERAA